MPEEKLESENSGCIEQSKGTSQLTKDQAVSGSGAPTTGQRQALEGIQRTLTSKELKESGALKLILELLRLAENECERLKPIEVQFHFMDKRVAVLTEELNSLKSIDILVTVFVCLGGVSLGFIPFFIQLGLPYIIITAVFGLVMIGSSVFVRVKKK